MATFRGHQDNLSRLLPKEDYGIKISKAGHDAITSADNDLLFDSAWPSLQIVKVLPAVEGDVVAHNLGFPTAAFVMGGTGGFSVMFGMDTDDTNVYVHGLSGDTSATLVIYRLDISTDVEYPYTSTQSESTIYNKDYGIKMVKSGLDIESTDLRDYLIHSRCGSPLILAVKTQATVNPVNPSTIIQYTSTIGYPTLNFGYVGAIYGSAISGMTGVFYGHRAYRFAAQQSQTDIVAFTDGFSVSVSTSNPTTDNRGSVVCLRSPMIALTNSVSVNY